MKCPSCENSIPNGEVFCTRCNQKLPEIIKAEIQKEIDSELKGIRTSYQEKKDRIQPDGTPHAGEAAHLSSRERVVQARKAEYKSILEEVLAGGKVTPEELMILNERRNVLGLSQTEALEVQKDVAKERRFDVEDMGDLSTRLVLEININKDYFVGEMNNVELRITNRSEMTLEKVCLSGSFEMLGKKEERSLPRMASHQQHVLRLPFKHTDRGQELVEIRVHYFDDKENPYVLKTEIEVGISARNEAREDRKSINLTITAGKIMGADLSHMAEIYDEMREVKAKEHSFFEDSQKDWKRLPVFFDKEETNRWRDRILIDKKMAEGERNYEEGQNLIREGEKLSATDKGIARQNFDQAVRHLQEAKSCFLKVRETNQDHRISVERIRQVDRILSEVEIKAGKPRPEAFIQKFQLNSACLKLNASDKRILLYSKKRITLGRHTENDIVLRLVPNTWKREYDEQVRELLRRGEEIPVEWFDNSQHKTNLSYTARISGVHAEIIERTGHFYIRDMGSTNGTFVDGKKLTLREEHLLGDGTRINLAGVLDLESRFYREDRKPREETDPPDPCPTVLGEKSDSGFGVDEKGAIHAIKLTRLNNNSEGEEYLILIRGVTIGKNKTNAIAIDGEKVSDTHARISYRGQSYWIEDLNSRYETRVNGEGASFGTEVPLGMHADIVLGDTEILFEGIP